MEDQFQSSPKLVRIWAVLRCIFVPNLEIVNSIGGELWHGQAQNGVSFDFGVQFDLEGQCQLSHKTKGILTKLLCTSGPNLVILAWTGDELSRGQARDYRTQRRTDRQTQATTIPKGQNWPRVKMTINIQPVTWLDRLECWPTATSHSRKTWAICILQCPDLIYWGWLISYHRVLYEYINRCQTFFFASNCMLKHVLFVSPAQTFNYIGVQSKIQGCELV